MQLMLFCENIAFTPEQVRRVFSKAQSYGLPVKLHAEQLSTSKARRWQRRFLHSPAIIWST